MDETNYADEVIGVGKGLNVYIDWWKDVVRGRECLA